MRLPVLILRNKTYLKSRRSSPIAPLSSSGISHLFIKVMEFNKREAIRRRPKKRAMAGQAQKRSPPHILADEPFNPPPADYWALDSFLRWVLVILANLQ